VDSAGFNVQLMKRAMDTFPTFALVKMAVAAPLTQVRFVARMPVILMENVIV
jgi:hypothetical protein